MTCGKGRDAMTDDTEDSSSTTDSQNSTASIVNFLDMFIPSNEDFAPPILGDSVNKDDKVSQIKAHLQNSTPQSSQRVKGQEHYPESCNNMQSHGNDNTMVDSAFSTDFVSGVGDFPDEQETSPADSGYHSLANVSVQRSPESETTSPQRNPFRGKFDFHVCFADCHRVRVSKNAPYTYSTDLGQLFVKMDVPCPIQFNLYRAPEGSKIRTMVVFAADEHVDHPVKRCMHHTREDQFAELVQILKPAVFRYESCNGHLSVVAPYTHPNIYDEPFSIQYKFGCRSSCAGGINRRSTYMIFSLEDCNGKVLGRDRVLLKICSSPGRDRDKELAKNKRHVTDDIGTVPTIKRRKLQNTCSGYRLLSVREENFGFLSKINDALNLSADLST